MLRSPWRFAAAASAAVVAVAHLLVTEDHLHESLYLGLLFVALELGCAVVGVLLLRRDDAQVWLATGLIGTAAIGAYVVSRAVGLPRVTDDLGNWAEPMGVVSVVFESLMTVLAVLALLDVPRHDRVAAAQGWRTTAPTVGGIVVLAVGMLASGTAAASDTGSMASMSDAAHWQVVGGTADGGTGVTRTYYIGADEVVWDYAPLGRNAITGKPFDETADTFVEPGGERIGSRYLKCVYRGYRDASFRDLAPANEDYLGLLGPVIRAEVGDTIRVEFRNGCSFPATVHPHGVFYEKDSEGAPYDDGANRPADDAVPPKGGRHTYVWEVPERAGPGPHDGSSVMWMYHSHTDEIADTNAGLIGPMVVTRRGAARADGSPADVDREVFALFSILNETQSPLLRENMRRAGVPGDADVGGDEFVESNLKHSINGYLYGNEPLISMRKGEHVRWYVMSMGTETDLHTPHWHGNDVLVSGMRMDVVSLLPASMVVADMVPDNVGTWLFHCHVNDHIAAGMMTRYQVTG